MAAAHGNAAIPVSPLQEGVSFDEVRSIVCLSDCVGSVEITMNVQRACIKGC